MKNEGELQKSQEDEADGKKEKEKTTQGLIEEILTESQDDVDEEKEKTLEDLIEEILEEELSVDVDVKRRGSFLWISKGSCMKMYTFAGLLCTVYDSNAFK